MEAREMYMYLMIIRQWFSTSLLKPFKPKRHADVLKSMTDSLRQ